MDLSSTVKTLEEGTTPGEDPGSGGDNPQVETSKTLYYWHSDFSAANEITFADGAKIAITGNTTKNVSSGNDITIDGEKYKTMKVSNGAQNTLTMPEGCKVVKMTFYSYVNVASTKEGIRTPYWREVAGTNYDDSNPLTCFIDGDLANPDIREFTIGTPSNTVTFTNSGEQLCYVLAVEYTKGSSSGIETPASVMIKQSDFYDLQGRRVSDHAKGVIIRVDRMSNGQKKTSKIIR